MNKKQNPLVKPFLKWVGGKRQLLDEILPIIDEECSTYVEPFIGGGAVLLELQPKKAIINDYNYELINVYNVIKNNPNALLECLEKHKLKNSEDYFYHTRALDRTQQYQKLTEIERASRIIYLNKTCYNGLYRVNGLGQFNSPFGKYKNPDIVNKTTILAVSKYLNTSNIKILNGDYKMALKGLRKGAFVYFDPPYMPISDSSSFTGYTASGFGFEEQEELRDECVKLHEKGIRFLLSNSYCEEILKLYGDIDGFVIKIVNAKRNINSVAMKRGAVKEVLIYNEIKRK
jgi:DNA adenine methylase